MTFERSTDWETIKQIVTHPQVYPHVIDDFSPSAESWEPIKHESACYVLVKDDDELLGLWAFFPHNDICWQIHTCLLPNAYGQRAKEAAKQLGTWLWTNTKCLRVITEVPDYNRTALWFAISAGMKEYGINAKSYMKDGELHDLILLGISKPGAK